MSFYLSFHMDISVSSVLLPRRPVNDCETLLSTRAGDRENFQLRNGLHQGSALSPLLCILIMDVVQAEIGKEPPW